MKKFYVLASTFLAFALTSAQLIDEVSVHVSDFENLQLAPESYYNGADEAGSFSSGVLTFTSNYYDWGGGSGFAYSNITDNQTPGFENQYSAITGKGFDNSKNYAVFTPTFEGDTLWLPKGALQGSINHYYSVDKLWITNTTYAYYSMKNGDMFAKKFGSPLNANGEEDGTYGKDFFYLTITAHNLEDSLTTKKDVYLADFRDDNPNNHYILDEWLEVELNFINYDFLTFSFTSSDNGEYGMNTPAYFAFDDFEVTEVIEHDLGIKENNLYSFNIYPNPANSKFTISGVNGDYTIYNLSGQKIMEFQNVGQTTVDISTLEAGVYFVKNTADEVNIQKLIIQ